MNWQENLSTTRGYSRVNLQPAVSLSRHQTEAQAINAFYVPQYLVTVLR
jgi:hypothetical protein